MSQTSATMPLTTASEYTTSDRMEHVKQKMILIEPRQMYEYKESKILSRLDGEMHEILQRNIANGEKAKLYSDGLGSGVCRIFCLGGLMGRVFLFGGANGD